MNTFPVAMLLQAADSSAAWAEFFSLRKIVLVVILLGCTWLIIRYLTRLLDFLATKSARSRFAVKWAQPVLRLFLWFGALLVGIEIFATQTETFIAAIASVGLALGFGAQDLVRNLLGGLVIITDRPFQLGDRVKLGDAYGEIDHIGLHSTRLTTPDDSRVTIPNSAVVSGQISNANSGVPDCQVVTDLYLPPTADPRVALEIGYEAAYSSRYLFSKKPVVALVSDILVQRPYLRLRIKAYVHDHRYEPRMQSEITERAKTEFLRRGMLNDFMPSHEPLRGEGVA